MSGMAIEKTLRFIALGSVFALPCIVFIVASSLFFPFITGKNFAFRILVEVAAGSYLALALLNPAYRPKRSWLLGAFAVFVLIVALADAFGAYPFKSFWSNFERMDGWVTLVHLFIYFAVAANLLNTEKLWRRFWHFSIGIAALVGLYGLLQVAGIASLNPGFSSAARIDATFGNPIYLAVYMLFHIGIAALLFALRWQEEKSGARARISTLYGTAIAFFTLILFMTGTRGAMLGLIGGTFLGALLFALSSREMRRTALGIVAGILVLAGIFFLIRDQAWVRSIPFLERLATISLDDQTTKARFMNWGMAWEGVKERPILGWGQENYAAVFDKYYNPDMYAQEQWFDRVHNIVFDWLVAAGFLGLVSYLSLFAAALIAILRKRDGLVFSPLEKSILVGILAGYFISIFFVFDNVMSYILFASVLAYVAWRSSRNAGALMFPIVGRKFTMFVALGALVLVWSAAWYVNARPLAANRTLLQAVQAQDGGVARNLALFKESIGYRTVGIQEAREQLVQSTVQLAGADIPVEMKQQLYATAVEEMNAMMEEAPRNARFPLFLGVLHKAFGDLAAAEIAFERAHELSPKKQSILFELGANRFDAGNVAQALETFKTAYELAPDFLAARINYASVAIRAGEEALADELLVPVLGKGAADPRVAAAYVSRGRYDKIAAIWEAEIQAHPDNAQTYFTLAAAYYQGGNTARAVATLEEVGRVVPAAKQEADALIQQIRQGTIKIQ